MKQNLLQHFKGINDGHSNHEMSLYIYRERENQAYEKWMIRSSEVEKYLKNDA